MRDWGTRRYSPGNNGGKFSPIDVFCTHDVMSLVHIIYQVPGYAGEYALSVKHFSLNFLVWLRAAPHRLGEGAVLSKPERIK